MNTKYLVEMGKQELHEEAKMTIRQLRLTLHATGLKNVAGAFKGSSDPYAEIKLLVSGSDGQPEERLLGRTEAIKNALSPTWTASFLFDCSSGKDAIIEVAVVDKIRKGRDAFIGCKTFHMHMQRNQVVLQARTLTHHI